MICEARKAPAVELKQLVDGWLLATDQLQDLVGQDASAALIRCALVLLGDEHVASLSNSTQLPAKAKPPTGKISTRKPRRTKHDAC